jgi:Streptogramin lyase
MKLTRVSAFIAVMAAGVLATTFGETRSVTTILGTGVAGYSDAQVNNPYGIIFGPDGALYFCDLDNQRIRRFDPKTRASPRSPGAARRATKATAVQPRRRP